MAKRKAREKREKKERHITPPIRPETLRSIYAILSLLFAILFTLSWVGLGGVAGEFLYGTLTNLFGLGYFLVPVSFVLLTVGLIRQKEVENVGTGRIVGTAVLFLSGIGILSLLAESGGSVGGLVAYPFAKLFDTVVGGIVLSGIAAIGTLVALDTPITFPNFASLISFKRGDAPLETPPQKPLVVTGEYAEPLPRAHETPKQEDSPKIQPKPKKADIEDEVVPNGFTFAPADKEYTPPPLSLLERDKGKPEVGDIKANANLIKRTLQNFGIVVEMDEVSIGPTVTRYALKPAEGVRLQKILALQNNLELALAAHPVRIEAPIPGKSLVGIEVPNTRKATVGLASLVGDSSYQNNPHPLAFALGRDIAGTAHFADIARAPHLLIAGATGSGKSVSIHALIASLLYRNGPASLRFIMIDPKRVELTLYNPIPHLLSPVITDPKKAILALKWAGKEMERRYNILESHAVRDISSYHENVVAKWKPKDTSTPQSGEAAPDQMPYIVVIVDELADIMQSYPRELEAAVVRLAQMSRAVGIHLVLSTQRPSVNVITGLIKANVPTRIALQVASQIDSRTILDAAGAEKLLGAGDMLYQSADMGKPHRIQTAYISEREVKSIVEHIRANNEVSADMIALTGNASESPNALFSGSLEEDEVDDDMFEEAKRTVEEAGKASTSFLQRKLRIGYSRAARLMDILEERGIIGPADGARPREVLSGSGSQAMNDEEPV